MYLIVEQKKDDLLREKVQQLREEKQQLRNKEKQLREEKKQLREEKKWLLDKELRDEETGRLTLVLQLPAIQCDLLYMCM